MVSLCHLLDWLMLEDLPQLNSNHMVEITIQRRKSPVLYSFISLIQSCSMMVRKMLSPRRQGIEAYIGLGYIEGKGVVRNKGDQL